MEQRKSTSPIRLGYKSKTLTLSDLDETLGKLPPQALDLEEAVLGALMLEKDALSTVIDILKPDTFYKDAHQEIYRAIQALFNDSEPIDLLTVTNQLRRDGKLEFVGGAYYITHLTTRVNSAANIEYHSRIITEQSIKRELIRIASEIHKDAFEDTIDVFELLDRTEQELFDVSETNIRRNYADMRTLMKEAVDELEDSTVRSKPVSTLTASSPAPRSAFSISVLARPNGSSAKSSRSQSNWTNTPPGFRSDASRRAVPG